MLRYICLSLLWLCAVCFAPNAVAQEAESEDIRQVTVGMYINDIQTVDLTSHSYGVDFYLWFRWFGDDYDPTENFEYMNTFDPEAHVETVLYDEPQEQPDGSLYQIVRHQGLFTQKFPVDKYPFDHQDLKVVIEDAEDGTNELVYIADTKPLTLNPEVTLPGYRIAPPEVVIRDMPYATAFGDLAEPDVAAYSRVEFIIPVDRPAFGGIFKTYIPVLLIILCAAFALMLDPEHVEARIGLAITALLTLVALQFTMLSNLPDVSYLTLLDQIYLASYLYILFVIGMVVRGTRTDDKGLLRGDGKTSQMDLVLAGPKAALIATSAYMVLVIVLTISALI